MSEKQTHGRKLGVMIVGLGGAVGSTAVAGIELLKRGAIGTEGLPLARLSSDLVGDLAEYQNIVFGGWDLSADNLADAAATHNVLTLAQFQMVSEALSAVKPLAAVGNSQFCAKVGGENVFDSNGHRASIETIRSHIREFRAAHNLDSVVVINLASTEKSVDRKSAIYASLKDFEYAIDTDSAEVSPAMLYAYASIAESVPYANFTPSVAADIPALVELARQTGTPIGGKDGKTGQTMIKTALAPAFKTRALRVEGWFSTNILGNRDGLALSHPDSLQSKVTTKGSVLDEILGYEVEDHIVDIRYYKPRGDDKEAWDSIDLQGFLGQKMQLKINFLCKDSILAAPLVIEIARLLDLAQRRGTAGVFEELAVFFKLPQTADDSKNVVHSLAIQEKMLLEWLAAK